MFISPATQCIVSGSNLFISATRLTQAARSSRHQTQAYVIKIMTWQVLRYERSKNAKSGACGTLSLHYSYYDYDIIIINCIPCLLSCILVSYFCLCVYVRADFEIDIYALLLLLLLLLLLKIHIAGPDALIVVMYDLLLVLRCNFDFKFNLTVTLRFCCFGVCLFCTCYLCCLCDWPLSC